MPRGGLPAWTEEELQSLTRLYRDHRGKPIPLAEFATSVGRLKSNVSRKAKAMGLTTDRNRKKPADELPHRLTKEEVSARLSEAAKRRWESPEYRGRMAASYSSQKMSAAAKKRIETHGHPRGALGMKHGDEAKAKMSAAGKASAAARSAEAWAERGKKMVETKLERYGTAAPRPEETQPYSRCRGGRREDLGGIYFRSSWEANYARYLNLLIEQGQILKWEYEKEIFRFEGVKRGPYTYKPDFKVWLPDGSTCFHEVKGWMDSASRGKLKRMQKHFPDVTLVIIGQTEYREISRISAVIQGWEAR